MRAVAAFVCFMGVFMLAGFTPVAGAALSAPAAGQTAAFFAPGAAPGEVARAVWAANGRIVRFGALPGSVIVDLPEGGAAALKRAGAWLVAAPMIEGGCAARTSSYQTQVRSYQTQTSSSQMEVAR